MQGRIKIIYMGTPEFAVAPLKSLLDNGFDIPAVVTIPDKPSGRGLKVNESQVKQFAKENNIDILQPISLKDPDFLKELANYNADLFIVVAFRMLPKIVWSIPKMGTFNLHASLLPQYRGAAPINWAIINGEKETGVTTFMIDDKIDTGAILMQRKCAIEPHETIGTLYDKLMNIGANLVIETVNGLINNSIKPRLQQEFISQEINIKEAPKITKEICRINWNNNAVNIERQIRGLSPYPCAITTLNIESKSIDAKIFDAIVDNRNNNNNNTDCYSAALEGTIITDNKSYLIVVCGNNSFLRINEIQIAGKKRMHIKDFLAGFRNAESYTFI